MDTDIGPINVSPPQSDPLPTRPAVANKISALASHINTRTTSDHKFHVSTINFPAIRTALHTNDNSRYHIIHTPDHPPIILDKKQRKILIDSTVNHPDPLTLLALDPTGWEFIRVDGIHQRLNPELGD